MPKRPLDYWWKVLFPGTPPQVPRRSYRGASESPLSGRGYVHPPDSPFASPRPARIRPNPDPNVIVRDVRRGSGRGPGWRDPGPGRYVSFGRVYRTHNDPPPSRATSAMSFPREHDRGDSARSYTAPDSTAAPTESQGSMQAFEIDSPLAVSESTGWAFSSWFVEAVAMALILRLITPRSRPSPYAYDNWEQWLRDYIDRHFKPRKPPPVHHSVISGTPQPKAMCLPGFPNQFTSGVGSPIAASA